MNKIFMKWVTLSWAFAIVNSVCNPVQNNGGGFLVRYWPTGSASQMQSTSVVPTTDPYNTRINQEFNLPDIASFQAKDFEASTLPLQETEFGMDFSGVLKIDTAGDYEFTISIDDAHRFWIDGPSPLWYDDASLVSEIWQMPNYDWNKIVTKTLTAGEHRIYGMMLQGGGKIKLQIKYKGPDTLQQYQYIKSSWYPQITIPYSSASEYTVVILNWWQIMQETQDCQIENCQVYALETSNGACGISLNSLKIQWVKPWSLTAIQNLLSGYTQGGCIKCKILQSQVEQIIQQNIIVTQTQVPQCNTAQTGGGGFLVRYWATGSREIMENTNSIPTTAPYNIRIDQELNLENIEDFNAKDFNAPTLAFQQEQFGMDFNGVLNIDTAGDYIFNLFTDDGHRLWIDGHLCSEILDQQCLIANKWASNAVQQSIVTKTLIAGEHRIYGMLLQGGYDIKLQLKYKGPDTQDSYQFVKSNYKAEFDIPYSGSQSIKIFEYWWQYLQGTKDCGVSECKLLSISGSGGCQAPSSPYTDLSMESSTPWSVSVKTNIIDGYAEDVCLQCTQFSGPDLYQYLHVKQQPNCYQHIRPVVNQQTDYHAFYSPSGPVQTLSVSSVLDIKNQDKCGAVTCSLKDYSACETVLVTDANSVVQMQSSNSMDLTFSSNIVQGYEQKVCLECTSSSMTKQVKLQFFLLYIDITDQTFEYAATIDKKELTQTFSDFVKPVSSGISSFVIIDQGCTSTYSGTHISIVPGTGKIFANQNVGEGYVETVCVKVLGLDGVQFTLYDNWKIEQKGDVCVVGFTNKDGINANFQQLYSNETTLKQDLREYLNIIDETNCDVQSAKILDQQCLNSFNSEKIQIDQNFELTAKLNVDIGYSEVVCIKFKNSVKTLTQLVNINQSVNCQTVFNQVIQPPLFTLNYNESNTETQLIANVTSLFSNNNTSVCKLTKCNLPISNDTFLSLSSEFKLQANSTVIAGYNKQNILIECEINNNHQTIIKIEPINVQQNKKPDVIMEINEEKNGTMDVKKTVDQIEEEQPEKPEFVPHWDKFNFEQKQEIDEEIEEEMAEGETQEQIIINVNKFVAEIKQRDYIVKEFNRQRQSEPIDLEEGVDPLGVWVTEFNQLGFMKLQFNQSLESSLFKLSDINSDVIFLFIQPYIAEETNPENLQFIWQATKVDYELGFIEIQVNFTKAMWVSSGDEEDIMKFEILNMELFQQKGAIVRRLAFEQQPLDMSIKIKRQMPNNLESQVTAASTTKLNSSLSYGTLIIFVLQVYIFSVFKKLIGSLMSLQIIVHLGIINVKIPGNTTFFIATLKQVTYFKLFAKLAELNKVIIPFDMQGQSTLRDKHMLTVMQGLGFQYFNCILNLGNTGQMIGINVSLVLAMGFVYVANKIKKKRSWSQRKFAEMKKILFFGPFLGIAVNGFIPICIAVTLNFQYNIGTEFGEVAGNYYSRFLCLYVFVWLPLVMLYVIFATSRQQQSPEFRHKYKFLLGSIKTSTKFQRTFYFFFVLRRLILIQVGMQLFRYPCIQTQIIMILNLLSLIQSGITRVNTTIHDYKLNLNTEMFLAVVCYHLIIFSDMVPDKEFQYMFGKSYMMWISFLLLINLLFVAKEAFRLFKLIMKRRIKIIFLKIYQSNKIKQEDKLIIDHKKFHQLLLKIKAKNEKKNLGQIANITKSRKKSSKRQVNTELFAITEESFSSDYYYKPKNIYGGINEIFVETGRFQRISKINVMKQQKIFQVLPDEENQLKQ